MITLTQNAVKQIEKLMAKAPEGTPGVRLNIKSTGCSGHSYAMEYVEPDGNINGDDAFEAGDEILYIPKMHSWMLFGTTIDYVTDELGNARFDFTNPNESGRCGCGESFHVNTQELLSNKKEDERENA